MGFEVGISCGGCGTFAALTARFCAFCGSPMSLVEEAEDSSAAMALSPTPVANRPVDVEAEIKARAKKWSPDQAKPLAGARSLDQSREVPDRGRGQAAAGQAAATPPAAAALDDTGPQQVSQVSKEDLMEQARHYVCKECSTPVPSGHKFCGRCGAVVPPQILDLRTDFFGAMQAPGKARLILIRGDAGTDGLSYLLQGTEHVAGRRDGQIVFPDDAWLSPRHANFVYRGDKLVVRDEGSLNGVYLRVRGQVSLDPGDLFLCGEQVFRLDRTPADTAGPDPDMTYFYSSPKRPSPFRIAQVLRGGGEGMVVCARENQSTVGREDCDLNFPEDVYMSANHARIVASPDGSFSLVDNNSKNGTYVRIRGERELAHGDYLFLGKQLLRVEITA